MGSGASVNHLLQVAAEASPGDLKPGLAWKAAALDSIVILDDYAIIGAAALGHREIEMTVPFSERGDEKLACIVDCGRPELWYSKFFGPDGCLQDKKIDIWIILMPSVDSDPRYYGSSFTQSMAIVSFVCSSIVDLKSADIRFVHRDFYFTNPIGTGFEWLPAFLANDAKILPGCKRDSMSAWLTSWVENVWGLRAGIHWAVGMGMEESEIREGYGIMRQLLEESKIADESEYRVPGTALLITVMPDGDRLQVTSTNMAGDVLCSKVFEQSDSLVELEAVLREEFPKGGPPTFWNESNKVQADSKIVNYKALTATIPLVKEGLPDLMQFPNPCVRLAIGTCNDFFKEFDLEEFDAAKQCADFDEAKALKWGEAQADIFFFADIESLNRDFDKSIQALRECIPICTLHLILIAKEFESFRHSNFVYRLNAAIEAIDVCVFATYPEIDKIKSLFLQKTPTYPTGQCLCQAMIPFPRLHFFTLLGEDGKTCGRDVADRSLMFTSMKYGIRAPTLPPEKFARTQYIVGPEGPLHFVTVPGESKVTVVSPALILMDVFKMAVEAGCTEGDDWERNDALSNICDLREEYKLYLLRGCEDHEVIEFSIEELKVPGLEEAPDPWEIRDPDGNFEEAQRNLHAVGIRAVKELRSLGRPPPRVVPPLKAAAVLLNVEISAADEWKDVQEMMRDCGGFLQKLLDIKPESITEEQLSRVQALAADASFTYAAQAGCSGFSAVLTGWVLALSGPAPT